MFVCQSCHDQSQCANGFIEGLMRSRGACEVCKKVADCLDCHGYKYIPTTRCASRHPNGQQEPGMNSYRCILGEGHTGPHTNPLRPDWDDMTTEEKRESLGMPPKDVVQEVGAVMKTVRWASIPEGEDATIRFIDQPDYVTCGAFLSMHHPVRRRTGIQECLCLIPVAELPKACPQCGQWKS